MGLDISTLLSNKHFYETSISPFKDPTPQITAQNARALPHHYASGTSSIYLLARSSHLQYTAQSAWLTSRGEDPAVLTFFLATSSVI